MGVDLDVVSVYHEILKCQGFFLKIGSVWASKWDLALILITRLCVEAQIKLAYSFQCHPTADKKLNVFCLLRLF